MGWGEKAIELRSVETGSLEGVFMHKKAQKLKFLCERNDKVRVLNAARSHANVRKTISCVGSLLHVRQGSTSDWGGGLGEDQQAASCLQLLREGALLSEGIVGVPLPA